MGATYTRQSSTEIVDGEVINAADFNNEFTQLVSAFAASTGHTHDGTSAEGGPVTKLLGTAITIGDGTSGTDIAVTFDGETSDGLLTWMEDEDHFKFSDDVVIDSSKRLYLFDEGGEHISGDGTDITIASGADINLTATTDVNIPANVGVTFGNDAEKIEGDGTDLTISGNNINLTATADVNIPSGVGLTFATTEKIESDGTDLSITVGSNGDINIPANIGLTFGDDGEKIEGDGTDLTVSGNNINLTATADVNIPSGVGLTFATAEKIESDGTDLSITVGSGGDINIPANIGVTFGDDGEKIEGDGTDLTISSSAVATVDAGTDIVLDADGGDIFFKDGGTTFGSATNTSGDLIIKSGTTTAMTFSGANVTFAGTVTIGSAGISEAELEILDGASVTTTELNIIDGDTSATSTTVADADRVVMNDNGTMVQVAVTDLAAYFDDEITAMPNLVTTAATTVGALASGSIATGFGNIDNGASNITSGGLVKLDVDADADDLTGDSATGRLTIGAGEDLNLYHGGTNSYIVNDTGDLIIDTAGDIQLDAAGNDFKFLAGGTEILNITNSSSDVVIKPVVDAKDIIFQQRDGTEVARIEDNATFNVSSAGKFAYAGTAVTSTAGELNLLDGSAKSTSSITVADADALIVIDGTTTKQIPASDIKTYVGTGAVTAINNATANELVTIGSTTTELDAEANLTFDGSTFAVTGDATISDDLGLVSDAAVLTFGADSEIKLTHVADTGLKLTDDGGTPTLQLHDADESIASDGSKVIITSGGTAFSLPTSDGSSGQALVTNGSAVLSFAAAGASLSNDANNRVVTGDGSGGLNGEANLLFDGNILFIADNANGDMTSGLTINQSGADNSAITLKSTDIATGMTTEHETDTYGQFSKVSGSEGGLNIKGLAEGGEALLLSAAATDSDTSDGSGSRAPIEVRPSKKDGTSIGDFGSSDNLILFFNNNTRRMLLKGSGALHLSNTTLVALDTEDDAMLVRQLDKATSTAGVIDTQWDQFVNKNNDKLKEIGVLSSQEDFIVVQPHLKLLNGATWQQRAMFETMKKVADQMLPGFADKLNKELAEQSLPALPIN